MGAEFRRIGGIGPTVILACIACGGNAEVDSRTVRGTVVDELGRPFPEVTVLLGNAIAVTDADGRFRAEAGNHYDVSLHREGARLIHAFQGMSIRDPVFKLPNAYVPSDTNRGCSVTVVLPGPDTESTVRELIAGLDGSLSRPVFGFNFPWGAVERPYSVSWVGEETAELVLYAFEYEVDETTGGPARYLRYAEIRRSITSGENVRIPVEFSEMRLATTLIQASAILPDDYRIWSVRLMVKPTPVSTPFWFLTASAQGPLASLLAVDLPGATYQLKVLAGGESGSTGRTVSDFTVPTPPLELTLEPSPVQLAPVPGANDVGMGSTFSWRNGAAGVAFVNVLPTESSDAPQYRIAVSGSEARLPDLSKLGVELPGGTPYEWGVFVTTAPSLDVLAAHGDEIEDLRERTYAYSGYKVFLSR